MSLDEALGLTGLFALIIATLWSLERRLEQRHRRSRLEEAEAERQRLRLALELARTSSPNLLPFRRGRRATRRVS